jgi:hypothetical protein
MTSAYRTDRFPADITEPDSFHDFMTAVSMIVRTHYPEITGISTNRAFFID